MIVKFDDQEKKARLSLKCEQIFKITDKWEAEQGENRAFLWRNEYGFSDFSNRFSSKFELQILLI